MAAKIAKRLVVASNLFLFFFLAPSVCHGVVWWQNGVPYQVSHKRIVEDVMLVKLPDNIAPKSNNPKLRLFRLTRDPGT